MRLIAFFLCFFSIAAVAATKHAPLPEAAYQAKTVFIANKTGYQSTTDGAYDALTKWGRMSVVTDRAAADEVLTFTYTDELRNGTTQWGEFSMTVQLKGVDEPIFQTSSESRGFHLASNRGAVGAQECVKEFRKRLSEDH